MRARIPALLVAVVLALVMACGSDNNTATTTPAPSTPTTATTTASATTSATSTTTAASSLSGDLNVFAASSLTDAFNEIGAAFQQANPKVSVKFNYGASSALRTQIAQGAKADVFASADPANMDQTRQAGAIDGPDHIFVKNKLVMIYPVSNPGKISSIHDLAKRGIRFVLTDPAVPIGSYARQSLQKMDADPSYGAGFDKRVLVNLKSEEANVRAVVSKVQIGEADAAIVYATDVTPATAKDITSVLIPDQFNVLATYPIAVVKDAPNKAAGQAFITFVRSAAGQAILKKWNFITDKDTGVAWLPPASLPLLATSLLSRAAGYSPSFTLGGLVDKPGAFTPASLQAMSPTDVTVDYLSGSSSEHATFTGVRLYDLLMAAGPQFDRATKNDALRTYVRIDAGDGYEAIIAWGEIDPGFENKPVLVAFAEDGQPLDKDGMARLVVPGDGHGGRYVSNITAITLLRAEQP
jgi:molybdate transport system substrate-binding protein